MASDMQTSPAPPTRMQLSEIWKHLPYDLTEHIFSLLVESYWQIDPAYTWVRLRQLSAHQKRVIELGFAAFWLPKLSITLYSGARHQFEYRIYRDAGPPNAENGDTATFSAQRQIHNPIVGVSQDSVPGTVAERHLEEIWKSYRPLSTQSLTVRLGEGFLSSGCRGGYLLNNTDLPGLRLLPGGRIAFRWKCAMDELLREEMYMRKFIEACKEWRATNAAAAQQPVPLSVQVRLWRGQVQAARRVAGLKHRMAKSQINDPARPSSLQFAALSKRVHQRWERGVRPEVLYDRLGGANGRRQPPNIFEVVDREESAVPHLPVFQQWLRRQTDGSHTDEEGRMVNAGTIVDLYGDEWAWQCRFLDRDGAEEQNAGGFLFSEPEPPNRSDNIEPVLIGEQRIRWMPLW